MSSAQKGGRLKMVVEQVKHGMACTPQRESVLCLVQLRWGGTGDTGIVP